MPRRMSFLKPASRDGGWSGMGTGFTIASTILAGMLVWGGAGFLLDRLLWTSRPLTGLGIVLGAAGASYIVYLRYGKEDS
jgi:hypothetical protein